MFTGIIKELGKVVRLAPGPVDFKLHIRAPHTAAELAIGDSVCINGVCLTVVDRTADSFTVDVMPETVRRTNLGSLTSGEKVNLEPSLRVGDKVGGHWVSGHVDGVGTIRQKRTEQNAVILSVGVPHELTRFLVPKGSVALDGISMTVVESGTDYVTVSVIPHTAEVTTLGFREIGDTLNLEMDMMGKVVVRYLEESYGAKGAAAAPSVTMEMLEKTGFV